MRRRAATWAPGALTAVAGAVLMGAAPVAPPLPHPPVPPVPVQFPPPFLERITSSGDTKMAGVFEACIDLEAAGKSAQARAKARPVDAPSPPRRLHQRP